MLFEQAVDIPEVLTSGEVSVVLVNEKARYSLRLKSENVTAIKKATGLKLPTKINTSSITKNVTCLKLGPDEWMVIADPAARPKLDQALQKVSSSFVCSVTEISHRNVAFTVIGAGAQSLVNVGCPLDLSLDAFPIGKTSRTIFESAQITLLRTGEDSFHVECWRSFGPYLRDFFERVVTSR